MQKYNVVEKFISINGEGPKAGELAVFIRFKGCNLNCIYCDTKWANEPKAEYEAMTADEILKYILESGVNNVTLTGGEPLLRDGMPELITLLLKNNNLYVEIETNGSIDLSKFISLPRRPSFTMDYKLSCSAMESRMNINNFNLLNNNDCVKFVVGSIKDMDRAVEIINKYKLSLKLPVYFSPCFGEIDPKDMVNYLIAHKLNNVKIQLQLHKYIWSPDQKGV